MEQLQVKPKILVIDDNPENRALAQATLEDEGYQVILAATGGDGIRAFETEHPDCILLDIRMPVLDGFEVCTQIRCLPEGPGTPIIFVTAMRDIDTFDRALLAGGDDFLTKPFRPTELVVRVQSALKLGRMSHELREYYELVRSQRNDLLRLQLQKERLTAFVVHDLKSPINSLDLHAQILLRQRELPPPLRESAQHIRDEARSLLRRVLNLLDISQSEAGKLTPRYSDVDLESLTAEVFDGLELRARAAGVSLTRSIEARELRADVDLLRRVLENLLDNAICHAPEASEVRLTVARLENHLEIRVLDAGAGVPPALREKIFDPFVRVETGERLIPRTGRGLGLAFCKVAIEAHGGRIWVEDSESGSAFCLRLPA